MHRLLLLATVLVTLESSQAYMHIFKTFTTTLTGVRNVSYNFNAEQNLTARDKQAILDIHNVLRAFIATGRETRGYKTTRQPQAANMQALSWDDYLADFSQNWANTNPGSGHSTDDYKDPRFKDVNGAENLSGDSIFLELDMYGEVRWWNYDSYECKSTEQCGHYLAFVNAYWTYMGCGWKKPALVCNFVGLITSALESGKQRTAAQHEYYKGSPCSMCEQGFDFCMAGGLCATKKQCESDTKNSCRCLNDVSTCAVNGGTFDAANCRCKCPPSRFGINCKHDCKDASDECGMTCPAEYPSHAYFCNKVCNGCGKDVSNAYKYWYVDRPPKNKDNIKTRGFWPEPVVTPPPLGSCLNKVPDSVCAIIASRNYCTDSEYKSICQRNCNTCGFQAAPTEPPIQELEVDEKDPDKMDLSGFEEVGDT